MHLGVELKMYLGIYLEMYFGMYLEIYLDMYLEMYLDMHLEMDVYLEIDLHMCLIFGCIQDDDDPQLQVTIHLSHLETILPSRDYRRPLLGHLGTSLNQDGAILSHLRSCLVHLGAILGHLRVILLPGATGLLGQKTQAWQLGEVSQNIVCAFERSSNHRILRKWCKCYVT